MNALFAPLAAYAANEVRGRVRRQVNVAVGYGVAALGGVGLLTVALVSLHRFLGLRWGPFWADLALAGLFIVVLAGGMIYAARQSEASAQTSAGQGAAVSAAAVSAAPVALSMLRRGGGVGVLGALAAVAVGVLAGRAASPKP